MIVVTFTPKTPNKQKIYGIMLRRNGNLMEVVWDETPDRPAAVGWARLNEQMSLKAEEKFNWHENALRLFWSGKKEEGMKVLKAQEDMRRLERLRKEHAL